MEISSFLQASQPRMSVCLGMRKNGKEERWCLGPKGKTFLNSWHLCPSLSLTLDLKVEVETLHLSAVGDIGQFTYCLLLSLLICKMGIRMTSEIATRFQRAVMLLAFDYCRALHKYKVLNNPINVYRPLV